MKVEYIVKLVINFVLKDSIKNILNPEITQIISIKYFKNNIVI